MFSRMWWRDTCVQPRLTKRLQAVQRSSFNDALAAFDEFALIELYF